MSTDDRVTELIRAELPRFTPAERRVAEAVLADPVHVIEMSVTELAELSSSSVGSVVRFCQTLGLRGFQGLKFKIAQQRVPVGRRVLDDVSAGDNVDHIVKTVFTGMADALADASDTIDAVTLERAVALLIGARQILVVGVGTSAPLATDLAVRLATIGLPVAHSPDNIMQHIKAQTLGPGDVCFAISHTGSTIDTVTAARAASAAGAATVALTSFARSPLTEVSQLCIVAGSRETAYRTEAMTSRVLHLGVVDTLFVLLTLRREASVAALVATDGLLDEHRF